MKRMLPAHLPVASFEDGGMRHEPRNVASRRWLLESGNSPQFSASQKIRTLVLKLQRTEFCNYPNKQDTDSPLEPLKKNCSLNTLILVW